MLYRYTFIRYRDNKEIIIVAGSEKEARKNICYPDAWNLIQVRDM